MSSGKEEEPTRDELEAMVARLRESMSAATDAGRSAARDLLELLENLGWRSPEVRRRLEALGVGKVREALGRLDLTDVGSARRTLQELNRALTDANSAFPVTQEFLRAKGLTHVSQLDKDGLSELEEFLQGKLAKLVS